jgi:nucleotide-binding universal stress UspA family protein
MFTTILVPLDGSTAAERALPYAVRLARAAHGRIVLLRAVGPAAESAPRPEAAEAHTYLTTLANHLRDEGLTVQQSVYHEEPATAIARSARSYQTGLVVMSTHARTPAQQWYLGSVADAVVRSGEAPVLLVAPCCTKPWPERATPAGRVLITLDGSALAEEALEPAAVLAEALGCGLLLVHVVPTPPAACAPERYFADEDPRVRVAAAEELLQLRAAALRARGLDVTVEATIGMPAAAIAAAAERPDVLATVMATHGQSGLERTVMGSTAAGVLLRTSAPLLLYRPLTVTAQPPAREDRFAQAVTIRLEPSDRQLIQLALTELLVGLDPSAPLAGAVERVRDKIRHTGDHAAAARDRTPTPVSP